jgi:hypothetical protein
LNPTAGFSPVYNKMLLMQISVGYQIGGWVGVGHSIGSGGDVDGHSDFWWCAGGVVLGPTIKQYSVKWMEICGYYLRGGGEREREGERGAWNQRG